ncbi:MAG: SRPBCC family protein [Candidatus Elarobacter sp.]
MRWERTAGTTAAASPEQAWDVLLDGRRWSSWNPGVEWIVVEGPLVSGSVLTMKPNGGPQTAFRIESVVPNRLLALVLTIGPVADLRLRWELAAVDVGTTIAQTIAISGPLAGVLLRRTAQRIAGGMAANLERLAARASAGRG